MKKEEIEAARSEIRRHLIAFKEMFIFPADIDNFTLPMLDALCAAARQQESLVGKRVRLKNANPSVLGRVIKQNKPYCILWSGGAWSHDYDRDDFELPEGDDAE